MHPIHGACLQAASTFRARKISPAPLVLALLAAFAGSAQASCGSAFCSINTDWGVGTTGLAEGSSFDLRYEDIKQDQPRAGSRKVAVGEIPGHHDEVHTFNKNLVGTYNYTWASGWGVSAILPLVDRDHFHIHNHHGGAEVIPEQWKFRELGDVQVVGRYQQALSGSDAAPRTAGAFFGLKLPTGKTDVANDDGDIAERSLQPGSGTTDLILGAYYHQQIAATGAAWFAQARLQQPLNSHDNFKPGAQLGLDLGYAHPVTQRFSALVQLNTVFKKRDSGAEAEPEDSGGRFVYLSPGLSYKLGERFLAYAYYQLPLYQYVNGVQLTTSRAFVVGVSTHF
ncbi:hypothetical protein GCM10028796_18280 [Ramlibacter monticola]|uniref:Transporter n=1 Tax=Ramlibacter monticola TaxID=1926872 RepID=A0A936YZ75_9BURK|nr:hypothetical protein [Ramlibacter monticola]MBL0390655.1 hypothetical protein [Ramlibacter monticola]